MSVGARSTSTRATESGSGTRKVAGAALPNLAVAGKRERKKNELLESRGERSEKRGHAVRGRRGGRDRGRGGKGVSDKKKLLIEQQGIFSSGLNDDGRHDRMKSGTYNEFGAASKIKKVKVENVDEENQDMKPVTYETEWISDEEADQEELQELLRDAFLSDLKPGKIIPLVLPESEEKQFHVIVKKENMENGYEMMDTSSPPTAKKKKKSNRCVESDSGSEEDSKEMLSKEMKTVRTVMNPTAASSLRAAAIMQKVQDEDGSFLMLQLPSSLSVLNKSREHVSGGSKPEENTNSLTKHCFDSFENGSRIGKLRIRKGGHVQLSLCGMHLDVTCGASTKHNESVLLIDYGNQSGTSLVKSEGGDEQSPSKGFILGKILHHFICSYNLPDALDEKRAKQERDKRRSQNDEKDRKNEREDLEMKDLLLELRSIEKKEETWSNWTLEYLDSTTYDDS